MMALILARPDVDAGSYQQLQVELELDKGDHSPDAFLRHFDRLDLGSEDMSQYALAELTPFSAAPALTREKPLDEVELVAGELPFVLWIARHVHDVSAKGESRLQRALSTLLTIARGDIDGAREMETVSSAAAALAFTVYLVKHQEGDLAPLIFDMRALPLANPAGERNGVVTTPLLDAIWAGDVTVHDDAALFLVGSPLVEEDPSIPELVSILMLLRALAGAVHKSPSVALSLLEDAHAIALEAQVAPYAIRMLLARMVPLAVYAGVSFDDLENAPKTGSLGLVQRVLVADGMVGDDTGANFMTGVEGHRDRLRAMEDLRLMLLKTVALLGEYTTVDPGGLRMVESAQAYHAAITAVVVGRSTFLEEEAGLLEEMELVEAPLTPRPLTTSTLFLQEQEQEQKTTAIVVKPTLQQVSSLSLPLSVLSWKVAVQVLSGGVQAVSAYPGAVEEITSMTGDDMRAFVGVTSLATSGILDQEDFLAVVGSAAHAVASEAFPLGNHTTLHDMMEEIVSWGPRGSLAGVPAELVLRRSNLHALASMIVKVRDSAKEEVVDIVPISVDTTSPTKTVLLVIHVSEEIETISATCATHVALVSIPARLVRGERQTWIQLCIAALTESGGGGGPVTFAVRIVHPHGHGEIATMIDEALQLYGWGHYTLTSIVLVPSSWSIRQRGRGVELLLATRDIFGPSRFELVANTAADLIRSHVDLAIYCLQNLSTPLEKLAQRAHNKVVCVLSEGEKELFPARLTIVIDASPEGATSVLLSDAPTVLFAVRGTREIATPILNQVMEGILDRVEAGKTLLFAIAGETAASYMGRPDWEVPPPERTHLLAEVEKMAHIGN